MLPIRRSVRCQFCVLFSQTMLTRTWQVHLLNFAKNSSAFAANKMRSVSSGTPFGPMLAQQKNVPPLPVPTVESTAYKYLESAKPHLSEAEYAKTETAVKEFIGSSLVKTLQERLQHRASEPGRLNWLADWWNDVAYMGYRDSVVVYVSYFYLHVLGLGEAWKPSDKPSRKAALMLKALLGFRNLVEKYVIAEYAKCN
jgi:carnitine O-acetyltransferase